MSDTTIRPWLAPSRGRATVPFHLRAWIAGARRALGTVLEFAEAYSVIETACLLAAVGFCAVFIAAAFGAPV